MTQARINRRRLLQAPCLAGLAALPLGAAGRAERLQITKVELFKVAVRSMAEISREVLEQAGVKASDINLFIPHQANQRITEAVADRLNVDMSRVYSNIAVHGNTSSASIPIALDECVEAGRIKEGDLVLMASFGGGVTWGAVLMRW